jgi:hypothetical protein
MKRTVNAVSDRLLGLLVPRVTAKAEPCGPLDTYYCGCGGNWTYEKLCCRYSGSCYPCKRAYPGC